MAEQKKFLDAEGLKYLWNKIIKNTQEEIANLVDAAPDSLNTLRELAEELQAHEGAYDALLQTVSDKLGKTETAKDSEKLGNQSPDYYAKTSDITSLNQALSNIGSTVNNKLGKTETAKDSEKLGGVTADSYAQKLWVAASYLSQADALSTYLNKFDAEEIYLKKDNAANTYLKIIDAERDFQPKGDYAERNELAIPLSNAEIISIIGGSEKVLKSPYIIVTMGEYDNSTMGQYYSYEIWNNNDESVELTGNDDAGSINATVNGHKVFLSSDGLSSSNLFELVATFSASGYESATTKITVEPFTKAPGTKFEAGGY